MKPTTVSVDVPQSREEVFAFLDVMHHHERFTNHMLTDWQYDGADSGVGSIARVQDNVGARGRRRASGTYALSALPSGGTRVTFTYAWEQAPLAVTARSSARIRRGRAPRA